MNFRMLKFDEVKPYFSKFQKLNLPFYLPDQVQWERRGLAEPFPDSAKPDLERGCECILGGCEGITTLNKHTQLVGAYRLLIFNKYSSHATFAFTEYAKENNIILLYLQSYSSHRFQLLNIAIFGSLSIYYSELVKENVRYNGVDVSKREQII